MAKLTQDDLLLIFDEAKKLIKPYEKGTVKARMDIEGRYDLWSEKDMIYLLGKKRSEMAFVALIVQSGYVGFYFTPIYCIPEMKEDIHPDLLKLLKGKGCFHLKAMTPELKNHIAAAMKTGFAGYKKLGWIAD